MCPLHADHELRKVDTSLLNPRTAGRRVHIRKPRNARVVETSLRRGFHNNGIVDVINDDESDDSESDFYDEGTQGEGVVYRLPASGIKLDFIDKIKRYAVPRRSTSIVPTDIDSSTRFQELKNQHTYPRPHVMTSNAPRQLSQANFARRSFREKQVALNLAQFANANKDLELGSDQVETLVGTLIVSRALHRMSITSSRLLTSQSILLG